MRWYEAVIIVGLMGYLYGYFNIDIPWWLLLAFGIGIIGLVNWVIKDFKDKKIQNGDRRWIYAIIAFLYNPVLIYLHYNNNMPIYGMSQSDMTDIFSLLGRGIGAFLVVTPLGLLTLLFKPKRKWETYWLVTMIISIIMGSLVISANSF